MFEILSDKTDILKYTAEIVSLEQACFADSWSAGIIKESLQNDLYFCAVSLYNDGAERKVCGYVMGTLVCGECEIQRICVDSYFRREGIGYSLMNYILSSISAESFFLEVREKNIPAVSLYKKADFVPYFIRKDYYGPGENAILMRRQ